MTKKLYIETYGCQMNVADSEVVASVMQLAGYEPTDEADEADAVLLNTCSVRENAENKIYSACHTSSHRPSWDCQPSTPTSPPRRPTAK